MKGRPIKINYALISAGTLCLIGFAYFASQAEASHTSPALQTCSAHSSQTCVLVTDHSGGTREVWLSNSTLNLVDSGPTGQFLDGHQLYYFYTNDAANKVRLFVVDANDARLVAFVSPPDPYNVFDTYFGFVPGPSGEKYPFISAGGGYLNNSSSYLLCIFDPASISNPNSSCHTGFKPYSTYFASPGGDAVNASGFRHNGGWVDDVDGDGYGDIHIPYLRYILTLSGRTGAQLGLSHFDVAQDAEPGSPEYFHSGRFYGGFTSFNNSGRSVLFASGNSIGAFDDVNCNVSRFFAAARWQPSGFQLTWSDYLSFSKTIFNSPHDSISNYSRLGNDLNKCAHRFSDSLVASGSRQVVIFNLFNKQNTAPACQTELLAEQRSNFAAAEVNAYNQCATQNVLPVLGSWSVVTDSATNGARLHTLTNSYAWGKATNVWPSTPNALLLQRFTTNNGVVRFDRTADNIGSFAIAQSVNNGSAIDILDTISGNLSRPKITYRTGSGSYYGAYPSGLGQSWGGIPELVLQDIDGDGLNEIQMENDNWFGYSSASRGLVLKTPRAPVTISAVSVNPGSGTGNNATFSQVYSSTVGANDISQVWTFLRSSFPSPASTDACYIRWDRDTNQIFLLNDAGTGWSSGVTPGGIETLSNSQCTVPASSVGIAESGNNLTLKFSPSFTTTFLGTKEHWMYANNSRSNSSWQLRGSWTVASEPSSPSPAPTPTPPFPPEPTPSPIPIPAPTPLPTPIPLPPIPDSRPAPRSGGGGGSPTTPRPEPFPAPAPTSGSGSLTLSRNLSLGTRGTDVTTLQNHLISLGYLSSGNSTGYYGPLTVQAVKQYQCQRSIVCSGDPATTGYGAVGPKTRISLNGSTTTAPTPIPTTPPTPSTSSGSTTFTRDLSLGSRGTDVIALQNYLIANNYLSPGNATGYYGPLTRAAVIKFQIANNITPAVGYFGPMTRGKIK